HRLAAIVGYGYFRLGVAGLPTEATAKVAIVQSSIDVIFALPTDEEREAHFLQYRDLTRSARQTWPDLDLVLWPESGFPSPDLISDSDEERSVEYFAAAIKSVWHEVTGFPVDFPEPVPMLVGCTTHDPAKQEMFNSALLISNAGQVQFRYFKNHRVMIGEYTPLADWFPVLQGLSPVGRGLTAGTEFGTFEIKGVRFAPTICFETTIPHLIRRQVNTLAEKGQEPDVLVNLTNDGWFFGTSCLDLHLACNVFRAVEMRKTNLVSANTGFSGQIDSIA
ncbi:unnamed protein product, partial [marine sediment metagenome]